MTAADPLEALLGYQLRRASAVMMADLAATLSPLDLRPTEASILLTIDANAHATQSDIGKALGIQRANMAPLIAGLTARGAIDRDAIDGRSQRLSLTASGRLLVDGVRAAIAEHEARFLRDVPDVERTVLIAHLRAIWG